jgi:hypothetical protein
MNNNIQEQTKWSENVILVDADYVDKVAFNLIVNFERMLGRRIPQADIAHWIDCVALDGGIREGDHETFVVLIHNKDKADRFIRRRFDKQPRFMDTGAQTWCEDGLAVVLITTPLETAWHTDAALLCHEAYHVVSMHFGDYMGEEIPSEEFVAYGVQVVSKALFEAHDKWKSRRIEVSE